jgi:hypothetical protein
MTELMKRYKAETGKVMSRLMEIFADADKHSKEELINVMTELYMYGLHLENQVLDGKTIEKFQKIIRTQCDEISVLKAQLTWRDVSEPTWKADWFLVKENHKGTIMYDVGWSDGTTFGNPLVVGWLPIPPAPEGE